MAKGKKRIPVKMSVLDALDAGSDVEELKEEMESWRDSLEDKLSHTEKYERVSEAADTLDSASVEDKCNTLRDAIEALSEESDEVPGCPEHVEGVGCPRVKDCKWDGVLREHLGHRQRIIQHNPPVVRECVYERWEHLQQKTKTAKYRETHYGSVDNQFWLVSEKEGEPAASPEQHAATKKAFEHAAQRAEKENQRLDTPYILPRIETKPAISPVKGLDDLGEKECTWVELQPYRGKSLSRADRLGNALSGIIAALDVIDAELSKYEGTDARVKEVQDAADEVRSACDEAEGVDFPGMYG